MKYSPCLNPQLVYNETLGTTISVPCGHCDACITQKGFLRAKAVEEQFLRFKYRFFITLTFSDENLPKAKFDKFSMVVTSVSDVDYKGRNLCKHVGDFSDEDIDFIEKQVAHFGFLPVLSRSIIRNFKKRLRFFISKDYGANHLFIYSCGEYGPTTFRPHYHLLIGCNSEQVASNMQQYVYKSWSPRESVEHYNKKGELEHSYGDVDFQRCYDYGSENYCAAYLSCTTHLPRIYRELPFSPFSSKSVDDGFASRHSLPSLRDAFYRLPVEFDYVSPKSTAEVRMPLPKFYVNRLFPRLPGYSKVDGRCLYGVYNLYRKYVSPKDTAGKFAQRLIDSFVNGSFVDKDLRYLYWLYDFQKLDRETLFNKLVRFYYCCKRVTLNCLELGVTLSDYLRQMVRYYSKVALNKLKQFYEFQQDLLSDFYHPANLSQLFGLYKQTELNNN